MRKDFAQKNPDIVARVVRAQKKAVDFINKNPGEAKTLAAKFTKLDAKIIDEAMPHVKFVSTIDADATKRFTKEIITMGETGVIKPIFTSKEVPDIDAFVAKLIDTSFLAK